MSDGFTNLQAGQTSGNTAYNYYDNFYVANSLALLLCKLDGNFVAWPTHIWKI